MPVSFDAYLVVGLQFNWAETTVEVTRYNEETGVPYQKKIKSVAYTTLDGRPLALPIEDIKANEITGLKYYDDDTAGGVIGFPVCSVNQRDLRCSVVMPAAEDVEKIMTQVSNTLLRLGCSIAPQLLLVLTCE